MTPSYLCPVAPRTTDVPHPGASTLISVPLSNQIGHKGLLKKFMDLLNVTNRAQIREFFKKIKQRKSKPQL